MRQHENAFKSMGQIAYEAYRNYLGEKGRRLPTWDALPNELRSAWGFGGREVQKEVGRRIKHGEYTNPA